MTHAEHSAGGQTIIGVTLALCVIACWVTTHITALFLGTTPTGMAAVMLVLLQCWLNVGLFIIAHDCMHGSLAPGWLRFNTGVGTLCLYLYAGFSYAKLCPEHYRHHANPGTADDPDFCVTHSTQVIPWYISFVRYYFGLREFAILTVFLVTYIVVFGVALDRMLLFWGLPAIASAFQLFFFGTYLPHRTTDTFVDEHRARSNDYGYLGSLLSCFHFGYHHEHHLYPAVPWWRLPKVRATANASHPAVDSRAPDGAGPT